jgi:hypothetical protein
LLIAADGVNSKIRAALRLLDALSFVGTVCITGEASFADGIPAPLTHDWGTVVGVGGVSLFTAPVTDKRSVWSLSYLTTSPRESVKPPLPLQ